MHASQSGTSRRSLSVVLWALATVGALGSAAYQRLTGPTVSIYGRISLDGTTYRYRLPRSGTSTVDRVIGFKTAPGLEGGFLEYRRLRSNDAWHHVPLVLEGDRLVGQLPRQPAAGKLEYTVTLQTAAGEIRLPEDGTAVTLRFKDPVPAWVLLPHIVLMFTALLVGIRAGLGAVWAPDGLRRLTFVTLVAMTVGGLILGPTVQKLAFGQWWAGFPFGNDLTDDKTMVMWLAWVGAAWLSVRAAGPGTSRRTRMATLVAALVMLGMYLVPHSVRGSELDYTLIEQGVAPPDAVTTGK